MAVRLHLIACLLLVALTPRLSDAAPLTVGVTTSAQLEGFNRDLTALLCARMAQECRIEIMQFPTLMQRMEDGTLNIGLGNTLKTPEREKRMLFSVPIWRSTSSFIAALGHPPIPPAEAKTHHHVCVVTRSRQEDFLMAQPGPQDNLIRVPGYQQMFDLMLAGTCDAALLPTLVGLDFLNRDQGRQFDYSGPPLTNPELSGSVHILVAKNRPDILPRLDAAITAAKLDGSLRALIARYFPFDIL